MCAHSQACEAICRTTQLKTEDPVQHSIVILFKYCAGFFSLIDHEFVGDNTAQKTNRLATPISLSIKHPGRYVHS